MAKKKPLPVWNVLYHNVNARTLGYVNIFSFGHFDHVFKTLKKMIKDFKKTVKDIPLQQVWLDHQSELKELEKAMTEFVDHHLLRCFWAKCEYEVTVGTWPPTRNYDRIKACMKELAKDDSRWYYDVHNIARVFNVASDVDLKLDIYKQITVNFSPFMNILLDYVGYNDYIDDLKRGE